jgi:NADH-quinone oxidoreductase subunit G
MGLRPHPGGVANAVKGAGAVYIVASSPAEDDPAAAEALDSAGFVIVQELYRTATAARADVVFPAQSFVEREGSYTSGLRRVQRFYPAVPPLPEARPDWQILAEVGRRLGHAFDPASPAEVMEAIRREAPGYADVTYPALARVDEQWPVVGGPDLYFGGTSYDNRQGLGISLPSGADSGRQLEAQTLKAAPAIPGEGMLLVPVERLYDRGATVLPSDNLRHRLASARLELSPSDATRLGIQSGQTVEVRWDGRVERLPVDVVDGCPAGAALLPRSVGVALVEPVRVEIHPAS